jgi:hypothetical protein
MPFDKLMDIAKAAGKGKPVVIETGDKELVVIKTGRSRFRANYLPAEEFPEFRREMIEASVFQVAAGDGLVVGGVFEIGLDRSLQQLLVDDGFEAQAVEFLEQIIFKARAVARAIVEDGEIEDAQGLVFLQGPALGLGTRTKR